MILIRHILDLFISNPPIGHHHIYCVFGTVMTVIAAADWIRQAAGVVGTVTNVASYVKQAKQFYCEFHGISENSPTFKRDFQLWWAGFQRCFTDDGFVTYMRKDGHICRDRGMIKKGIYSYIYGEGDISALNTPITGDTLFIKTKGNKPLPANIDHTQVLAANIERGYTGVGSWNLSGRMKQFWDKYGTYIKIGGAVVGLGLGAYGIYRMKRWYTHPRNPAVPNNSGYPEINNKPNLGIYQTRPRYVEVIQRPVEDIEFDD